MKAFEIDAVVTIDVQMDYFPGGKFVLWGAQRALKNTRKVLDWARRNGTPIFHIQHFGLSEQARFLKEGTAGTLLHPGLGIPENGGEVVIPKHAPDSFIDTSLHKSLEEIGAKRILWMGMITWMCVDTTVRRAKSLGYDNILAGDACASGWLLKGGLPIFPWSSQRAFLAALGAHHAKVVGVKEIVK